MDTELSFESILKRDNNWLLFKELYKDELSEDIIHEVEKMLKCCSPECGFATYICPHCGITKRIPFSCKSKLCSRCGKKHTDIWAQDVSERLLNCNHRHIILTISDKLWPFFINNPCLQKLLLDTAARIINKVFSLKQGLTLGLILVLHPFGDDLDPNFHVHTIVSAGGLSKDSNLWVDVTYIDYNFIRKTWQYEILTALRKHLPNQINLNAIIDWCFKYKVNGFIIFADRVIKGSKRAALSYIARYTRHPAISKRRIVGYDGTCVSFSYEAYGKEQIKKMPKFEFIRAILQHVASRQFKAVRRFGLYSRRACAKYNTAKSLLAPGIATKIPRFNWRKNLTVLTDKDPLDCENCGQEMVLFSITYRYKFGCLKTKDKDIWQDETFFSKPLEDIQQDEKQRWRQICMPGMPH